MPRKKKILLTLAILLSIAAVCLTGGVVLYKGTPEWYTARAMTPQQQQLAAEQAERKIIQTHNWAAEAGARERATASGTLSARAATRPFATNTTITFTADELNAFFRKWAPMDRWDPRVRGYLSDPVIILHDNRLVLAATITSLGAVVSVHFEPALDADKNLRLDLRRVLAGKLPMPTALWTGQKQRIATALEPRLPNMQRQARMDPLSGSTNGPGVAAAMTKLLISVINNKPAEPIIFLPYDERHGLPVRVTDIRITDNALVLHVQSLTPAERTAFFARLKEPMNAQQTAMTP